jgi:hypothetical protein
MQTDEERDILLSGKKEIKIVLINISIQTYKNMKLSNKHLIKNSRNAQTGFYKE